MKHFVSEKALFTEYPDNSQEIILGAGCFWGVERIFWEMKGVWVTYASYSGGDRSNPTYEQVCTGVTGHAETVTIIYEPNLISTEELLKMFWECHDPTQGDRQGNDIGEQYRSVIYCTTEDQLMIANATKSEFNRILANKGYSDITTEIKINQKSYPAEDYHQQYLAKNPNGYCGIKGTGCVLT